MRKTFISALLIVLCAVPLALAKDQSDEPAVPDQKAGLFDQRGVDLGIALAAGKALRVYDFTRLNNRLMRGGADPFSGRIDDWNFELNLVAPTEFFVAVNGGFWSQDTGGNPVSAELSGYEIFVHWGTALADNDMVQVFPSFGIGYAEHTLTLKGGLHTLGLDNLPRSGETDLTQYGLLLEAALRADLYSATPKKSAAAFLTVESLSLGWQGIPVASDWKRGDRTVSGFGSALNNLLFVRLNLGLGLGLRFSGEDES